MLTEIRITFGDSIFSAYLFWQYVRAHKPLGEFHTAWLDGTTLVISQEWDEGISVKYNTLAARWAVAISDARSLHQIEAACNGSF